MHNYVLVNNRPHQIATIHRGNCSYLGLEPLAQTPSATRSAFHDLLDAIKEASMARTFDLCSHCLGDYRGIFGRRDRLSRGVSVSAGQLVCHEREVLLMNL